MRTWFRNQLRKLIMWALATEIKAIRDQAYTEARRSAAAEVDRLRSQVQALIGVDVDCHPIGETGHVVIMARVGKRDIVRIVDIPKQWTMQQYKEFVDELDHRFGIRHRRIDVPSGISPDFFLRNTKSGF